MFYCERYFLKLLTLFTSIKFKKEIIFVNICVWSQMSFLLSIMTIINIKLSIINVFFVKSNFRPPNNITPKPHSFFSRNCTSKTFFSFAKIVLRFYFLFNCKNKKKNKKIRNTWVSWIEAIYILSNQKLINVVTLQLLTTVFLPLPLPRWHRYYAAYTLPTDDAIGGVCFVCTILRFILSAKKTATATSSTKNL